MAMLMKKCYVRLCRFKQTVAATICGLFELDVILVSHSMHSGQLSTAPRDTIVRDFIVGLNDVGS